MWPYPHFNMRYKSAIIIIIIIVVIIIIIIIIIFYTKANNCEILVKCSWLVWRGVSSRPRDSSETFRIHRQTRWISRPKSRSQILASD